MLRQAGSIAAAVALLVLCSPPPHAAALTIPVVDPAALPPDGPPSPNQPMRQNGPCSFYGALPGFDPAVVPPSQNMLNLPEAWKTSRGRGVAVAVIDSGVEKFPFRIQTIRSDRGHEFQALFHWHVADQGMEPVYIKPRTPQLNGKVERSHRSDKAEFYQLLTYKDDVDLEEKLAVWERFYNNDRPHGAHKGKTPYEVLREKLRRRPTSGAIRNITLSEA